MLTCGAIMGIWAGGAAGLLGPAGNGLWPCLTEFQAPLKPASRLQHPLVWLMSTVKPSNSCIEAVVFSRCSKPHEVLLFASIAHWPVTPRAQTTVNKQLLIVYITAVVSCTVVPILTCALLLWRDLHDLWQILISPEHSGYCQHRYQAADCR